MYTLTDMHLHTQAHRQAHVHTHGSVLALRSVCETLVAEEPSEPAGSPVAIIGSLGV